MKMNKMFALLATTLILLSATGYAYAHWSDYVTIEGEVHTGSLEIVITDKLQQIWVWIDGDHWELQDNLPVQKQVMWCSDTYEGPEVLELCDYAPDKTFNEGMWKGVKFAVYNVYPETAFYTYTHIHNVGSIPAHWVGGQVYLYTGNDDDGNGVVDDDEWVLDDGSSFAGMGITVVAEAYDEAGLKIYDIILDPQTGIYTVNPEHQFHPCEGIYVYITFYFDDYLPECEHFRGEIVFDFNQWNWALVPGQPELPT